PLYGSSSVPVGRDAGCASMSLRVSTTGVEASGAPSFRTSGGAVATVGCAGGSGAPGCDGAGGVAVVNKTAATITPSTPTSMPSFASLVIGSSRRKVVTSSIRDKFARGRLTSTHLRETLEPAPRRAAHRVPSAPSAQVPTGARNGVVSPGRRGGRKRRRDA